MNRRDRRAAKALSGRGNKSDGVPIVAVHEAGHAVAKVLSIGELGYSINDAIERIELGSNPLPLSNNGNMLLLSEGVTYGPIFSREINEAALELINSFIAEHGVPNGTQADELLCKIIQLGRAAGANIDRWFRTRVFNVVSGSMAEAIYSSRLFYDVWQGYQAKMDRLSVVGEARIAQIAPEKITSTIERMAVLSAYMMENRPVWAAVLALAKKLNGVGLMKGNKAVECITSVLSESDLSDVFAGGINRLSEFEAEISGAEVVVAFAADGSRNVIKGERNLEALRGAQQTYGQLFFCRFPTLGETLWHAFGDGALPDQPPSLG